MFKTRTLDGKNNLCGENICRIRKAMIPKMSQRALAEQLQLRGMDVDKNAVQRMECGKRFVTDIELKILCEVLHVTMESLVHVED